MRLCRQPFRRAKAALAAVIAATMVVGAPLPASAQGNDDDYTPLNSRIRRDRPFPLDVRNTFDPAKMTKVMRDRSKDMLDHFTKCLWNRSNEESLSLLSKTDMGFVNFQQIGLETDRAARIYGFRDCLGRVATANHSGVQLRFNAAVLRQWLLQEAYLDRFPTGPSWVQPGHVIAARTLPLSEADPRVSAVLDFADCVVQTDPIGADYFFRTPGNSPDEQTAANALLPSLGPCFPNGAQMQLQVPALKMWVGEGLWHAAINNAPAPNGAAQEQR